MEKPDDKVLDLLYTAYHDLANSRLKLDMIARRVPELGQFVNTAFLNSEITPTNMRLTLCHPARKG